MKKLYISIVVLLLFQNLYSQTPQSLVQNLQKYGYYRYRLLNDFIATDDPDNPSQSKQGTYIPFGYRNYVDNHLISTGQNPIGNIGEFLSVLATEYRLLKDYGQDYSETRDLIAKTLATLERLDYNAEKFFRAEQEPDPSKKINPLDDDFWDKIDGYIRPEDLNGFMIRNDVNGTCNTPNFCNDVYIYNETTNVLNYSNGELKTDNLSNNEIWSVQGMFTYINVIETEGYTVMSQDEIWLLMPSLRLLVELVDDETLYTDATGEQVTIADWTRKITHRTVEALHYTDDGKEALTEEEAQLLALNPDADLSEDDHIHWRIRNPVTLEIVPHGSGTIGYSFLFAKSANEICGNAYGGHQTFWSRLDEVVCEGALDFYPPFLTDQYSGEIRGCFNLAVSSDYRWFNLYFNFLKWGSYKTGIFSYEYYPLLYCVITHNDIFNYLNNTNEENLTELYTILEPLVDRPIEDYQIEYNLLYEGYMQLLNLAPECGIHNHSFNRYPNIYWYFNRTGGWNTRFITGDDLEPWKGNYDNGLSYMLLHNLFWLVFMDPQYYPVYYTECCNYPFDNFGSEQNPLIIEADLITSSNIVNENGWVSYYAKEINLGVGFEAEYGSEFDATACEYFPTEYHLIDYKPCGCVYVPIDPPDNSKIDSTKLKNNLLQTDLNTKEEVFQAYLQIFPNPATNIITINFAVSENAETIIKIFNIFGQLQSTVLSAIKETGEYSVQYNISDLADGMYICTLQNGLINESKKIIKQSE